MYFNGVNAYVKLSPPPISNVYTAMIWMNSLGSTGRIQNAFRWGCFSPIIIGWIDGSYSVLRVWAHDGYWKYVTLANPNTVKGRWIHVSSVVIDNQALYGYLNASLIGSVSIGTTTKPTSSPMYVGAEDCPGYPYYFFYGYIAQVLIYSRALSDSEIIHNMSNPNNPIRNGLVLWLDARACDTSKNICWDLSGNGNHGTMYGVQIVSLSNPVRVGGSL
jgi:hypothetical protein